MHQGPPAPLSRPDAAAFHYHTYSYPGDTAAGAFQLSGGLPVGSRFYSLVEDLNGLVAWGNAVNNVPNLAVAPVPGGAQTIGGRDTLMLSLGPAPGAVNAPAVVFTGGIHAREWIAVEFTYLLAEYLVRHYTTAPANGYQQMIRQLVDTRRIYILPMLNPDGNIQTVFGGDRNWRKNRRPLPTTANDWVDLLTDNGALGANPAPFRNVHVPGVPNALAQYQVPVYDVGNKVPLASSQRYDCPLANGQTGVDPNRNFATRAWGYDGLGFPPNAPPQPTFAADPLDLGYFGPAAASEVETSNAQIALAHASPGLAASIDYHSRGQLILFPTEASDYAAVDPDYAMLGTTLWNLVRSQAALDYELGTPRELLKQDAPGTLMDYAAEHHQSRAFTIELDPALTVADGWVLPETSICDVLEKNIRGALAALAAPLSPADLTFAQRTYQQIVKTLKDWHVYGRGNQLPQ